MFHSAIHSRIFRYHSQFIINYTYQITKFTYKQYWSIPCIKRKVALNVISLTVIQVITYIHGLRFGCIQSQIMIFTPCM